MSGDLHGATDGASRSLHVLFGISVWGLAGGTERYALTVVPALLERGHRVTILCAENRADELPASLRALPTLVEPGFGADGLPPAEAAALARHVEEVRPDVVFVQALRQPALVKELAERAPLVHFVHDHTLFCPGLNKYREDGELCTAPVGAACLQSYWLGSGCICFKPVQHSNRLLDPIRVVRAKLDEIEVNKRAALLVTNSRYMRGELIQAGFAPDRVRALPMFTLSNGPHQPPAPLPAEIARFIGSDGVDVPLLFTPARLTLPDKGVDYLLTSLAALRRPFRAVIAGTGPAEQWLREKAREEGLADRVHFAGWQPQGVIEALYSRAAVVVVPSVWNEPFGLVGLEAMAHAKPVVAFGVGGIPEWLADGRTGLCVPRRDTAALAAAIDGLLADPSRAEELGRIGRRRMEELFGAERHMAELEDAFLAAAALPVA